MSYPTTKKKAIRTGFILSDAGAATVNRYADFCTERKRPMVLADLQRRVVVVTVDIGDHADGVMDAVRSAAPRAVRTVVLLGAQSPQLGENEMAIGHGGTLLHALFSIAATGAKLESFTVVLVTKRDDVIDIARRIGKAVLADARRARARLN